MMIDLQILVSCDFYTVQMPLVVFVAGPWISQTDSRSRSRTQAFLLLLNESAGIQRCTGRRPDIYNYTVQEQL